VAEGARLESVYTFTGIGGSNPSLSATLFVLFSFPRGVAQTGKYQGWERIKIDSLRCGWKMEFPFKAVWRSLNLNFVLRLL
jgi:hypothetical protein